MGLLFRINYIKVGIYYTKHSCVFISIYKLHVFLLKYIYSYVARKYIHPEHLLLKLKQ